MAREQRSWELPDGWVWRTVEEISGNIVFGHESATDTKIARVGGDIPLILPGDLEDTKEVQVIRWTTVQALKEQDPPIPERYILRGDRLLLVKAREGTAGKVGIFRAPAVHNKSMAAILPEPDVSVDYLFYCFREKSIHAYVTDEIRTKTEMTRRAIQNAKIPVPPLNEQSRIVDRIEALLRDVDRGRALLRQMQENSAQLSQKTLAEDIRESVLRMQASIQMSHDRFADIEQGIIREALEGKLFRRKESA